MQKSAVAYPYVFLPSGANIHTTSWCRTAAQHHSTALGGQIYIRAMDVTMDVTMDVAYATRFIIGNPNQPFHFQSRHQDLMPAMCVCSSACLKVASGTNQQLHKPLPTQPSSCCIILIIQTNSSQEESAQTDVRTAACRLRINIPHPLIYNTVRAKTRAPPSTQSSTNRCQNVKHRHHTLISNQQLTNHAVATHAMAPQHSQP